MKPVVVENIIKTYRTKKSVVDALKGISFSVEKGEIFRHHWPGRCRQNIFIPDSYNFINCG